VATNPVRVGRKKGCATIAGGEVWSKKEKNRSVPPKGGSVSRKGNQIETRVPGRFLMAQTIGGKSAGAGPLDMAGKALRGKARGGG